MQFGQKKQENPVSKYLTYKNGEFTYYDKEKKLNTFYSLNEFIVLKTGYCVKGYSSQYETGVRSNEVEFLNEELLVQTFKDKNGRTHTIAGGVYKDIKMDLPDGVNLHKCLTVLHNDEIVHLSLKGNAMWIISEFLKMVDISKIKVKFEGSKMLKKGKVQYHSPIFGMGPDITEDEYDLALEKLKIINENAPKKEVKEDIDDVMADLADETSEEVQERLGLNEKDQAYETPAISKPTKEEDDLPF